MRPKSEVIRLSSRFLSPMSNYNFVVLMTVASSAIEDSYLKWVNRMRIPPKVEKHNLDLDWPDTPMGKKPPALSQGATIPENNRKEAAPPHPSGPYIEFKLLSDQLPKTYFESAVLKHFEVLDAVKIDLDDK